MATENETINDQEYNQAEEGNPDVQALADDASPATDDADTEQPAESDDEAQGRAHRQAIKYRRQLRELEAASKEREEADAARIDSLDHQLAEAQWQLLDNRARAGAGPSVEQMQKLGRTIDEFRLPDGELDYRAYRSALDEEMKALGHVRGRVPSPANSFGGSSEDFGPEDKRADFARKVAGERFLKGY